MTTLYREQQVLQNPILGMSLLWTTASAHATSQNPYGLMPLPLAITILPILFHRASVDAIKRMQFASGLGKAVTEHHLLSIGLQSRLEGLLPVSLSAISLGCASSLLGMSLSEEWPTIGLRQPNGTLPTPLRPLDEQVRDMHKAAKRLGHWYATLTLPEVFRLLRITY